MGVMCAVLCFWAGAVRQEQPAASVSKACGGKAGCWKGGHLRESTGGHCHSTSTNANAVCTRQ